MTIDALLKALQDGGYLTSGALALPAKNTLGSPALDALLGTSAYYPDTTLRLALDGKPVVVVDGTIPVSGTFGQPFLGTTSAPSTVTFTVDKSGTPQLAQTIGLPAKWTFSASFPALKDAAVDGLAFGSASFVLASAAGGALSAGLNFAGTVAPASPALANLKWLWASGTKLALGGPVTLPSNVAKEAPAMALSGAPAATTIGYGTVGIAAGLSASVVPAATPLSVIGLGATLNAPGLPQLALSGTLDEGASILNLSAGTMAHPLANVNDLAALAGGTALGNLIPSQFTLGNELGLVQLGMSLLLSPTSGTLVGLTMGVGLTGMTWQLIPKVQLSDIVVTFSVAFPLSSPSLSAAIAAVFDIDTPGKPEITLGLLLPSLAFSGALTAGEIDVVSTVSYFFGTPAPSLGDDPLKISALNFTVDAASKLYAVQATIDSDLTLKLPLGSDLALPELTLERIDLALRRQTTVFYASLGAALTFLGANWTVSADYSGSGGWVFGARLTQPWPLTDLMNALLPKSWALAIPSEFSLPTVTALGFTYNLAPKTFSFNGGIAWTLKLTDSLSFDIDGRFAITSTRPSPSAPAQYSGQVQGRLSLDDITLTVNYAFQPNNKRFTVVFKEITGIYDTNSANPADGPYVRIAFGNTSVGGILEFLVGLASGGAAKLPSPWNVLDSISLDGLQITIYLNTKSVEISYPISLDLGFIKINKIEFGYKRQYGQGKITLAIDANFFGQDYSGANALKWDPVNESPPAVPGAGAALFDLQYLGLGQHVSLRNVTQLDTVDKVIAALKSALYPIPDPKGNPLAQLPALAFDSGSNWLIGAQFTIAGTFSMSLVFNDPNVYGLLIQLAGTKAGIFAGLRFEILYRKITDSIGVYHIDLKLPDAMRHLEFGEVSVTLPIVTLDVYTNGDFRIDVGFPTSLTDFSRCIAVEVFPFIGVGGFYFGKLSGETSAAVPKIDNGRFDPLIEFGLSLFDGLGKTLSLGILSGGISITVQGIVEGVYASFEPSDKNLPSATFFQLTGTIAVVGKVWATVVFGIIEASVSLTVYAAFTLAFETYEPIQIQ
ncbi:MAG: hypothetical protein QOI11_1218, partial [Candidatus Eremiobacteraeota bacterium]|nr:hypothetical protein [Candidatus Eremiobacteraeota bacterium]